MNHQTKTPFHVEIFEEPSYGVAKEKFGDSALMERVESSFGTALASNPYFGEAVPFTKELYAFKTQAFPPLTPSFRILYRYAPENDPYNVYLLSIQVADDTPYENSH